MNNNTNTKNTAHNINVYHLFLRQIVKKQRRGADAYNFFSEKKKSNVDNTIDATNANRHKMFRSHLFYVVLYPNVSYIGFYFHLQCNEIWKANEHFAR